MSNNFNYEEQPIYKRGCFYFEFGTLLMDPKTTIDEIADFAIRNGLEASFVFGMMVNRADDGAPKVRPLEWVSHEYGPAIKHAQPNHCTYLAFKDGSVTACMAGGKIDRLDSIADAEAHHAARSLANFELAGS